MTTIEFVSPVPFGNNKRENRFSSDDGWSIHIWEGLHVTLLHSGHGSVQVRGVGFTVLESAAEGAGQPSPAEPSTADSGAAVDQGLTGLVGSTPARSARKRK